MPKIKTKRSAAKRFKVTGSGKILHYKPFGSHLLTGKSAKRRRNLRGSSVLSSSDKKAINRLIPYQ